MVDARRGLTADERLETLRRDRARVRRERMVREVAGPIWQRMVDVVPVIFRGQGIIAARIMRADPALVIEALQGNAVFAVDTAMRLAHGFGFLAGGDVQAYVTSAELLDRLARDGLIEAAPCADTALVRPWAGSPRLLACVVTELPPWRLTSKGYRTVTAERLRRELVGAVGARADLFALLERAENRTPGEIAR